MPPQEKAALFADLATRLSGSLDESVTAGLVASLVLDVVPGAEHAAVSVRSRRSRLRLLASSSRTARELVECQRDAPDGPVWDALTAQDVVRSDDLAAEHRWSRWSAQAVSLGVGSVLVFPLVREQVTIGVLSLYAGSDCAFASPPTTGLATLYARHATNALVAARHVSGLQTALESRHVIGMAQGILMARFGVDEEQSFAVMQRVSSGQNLKLRVVARHVVDTGELPEPSPEASSTRAVADPVD